MRRLFVLLAITAACFLCALGLVLTGASSSGRAKTGSPNFVCVATWNFGICIGPPTKRG